MSGTIIPGGASYLYNNRIRGLHSNCNCSCLETFAIESELRCVLYSQYATKQQTTTLTASLTCDEYTLSTPDSSAPISTVCATRLHTSSLPSRPLNTMTLNRSASTWKAVSLNPSEGLVMA
jgi:hypothetical protein